MAGEVIWQVVATTAVTLLGVFTKWKVDRDGLLQKKTEELRALAKDGYWRTAHSVELQSACWQAVGRRLSEDVIRFAFERKNTIDLLWDCRRADDLVCFNKAAGFKDVKDKRWIGFRASSLICMVTGVGAAILLPLCSVPMFFNDVWLGVAIGLQAAASFVYMAVAGARYEAASRLLSLKRYPEAGVQSTSGEQPNIASSLTQPSTSLALAAAEISEPSSLPDIATIASHQPKNEMLPRSASADAVQLVQ